MSIEILGKAKTCFSTFQARLSHIYSAKEAHYAYISTTDKKIYLINDPIDLLNSVAEKEVLAQFFKKLLLSFGQRFPQLLPHYIFIANHIFSRIHKQVNNSEGELNKFRVNLRSEVIALKSFISDSLKTISPKYSSRDESYEYLFQTLLKFSSPQTKETISEVFKEIKNLTGGFSKQIPLKSFLIDICKKEVEPFSVHHGLCIEIEDLMFDTDTLSSLRIGVFIDFTDNTSAFGLEYNYEDLTPEMHRVLKAYEQEKYQNIIEKIKAQGIEIIISFGDSPPQFDDILTVKKLVCLKLKESEDLYQVANLFKASVYRFNEITNETNFFNSYDLGDLDILRLTRRSFLRLSLGDEVFSVINCKTAQEKIEMKKYLELLLNSISNLQQNNWEIFELKKIFITIQQKFAENEKEFECLKTYRLLFDSISDIILSHEVKMDKQQSWLDVCDTQSSWDALFQELLNTLQMTLKLDKIIGADNGYKILKRDEKKSNIE